MTKRSIDEISSEVDPVGETASKESTLKKAKAVPRLALVRAMSIDDDENW